MARHYGTAATLGTVAPRHARPLPDPLLLPCSDQNASNQPGQGTRNISTARYKEVLAEYLEGLAAENTLLPYCTTNTSLLRFWVCDFSPAFGLSTPLEAIGGNNRCRRAFNHVGPGGVGGLR
jgi:hypothetical protein